MARLDPGGESLDSYTVHGIITSWFYHDQEPNLPTYPDNQLVPPKDELRGAHPGSPFASQATADFLSRVTPDDYQRLHDKLEAEHFNLGGALIPFYYYPYVLDKDGIKKLRHLTTTVSAIMEKVVSLYFSDPAVRSYVALKNTPEIQAWIDHDPGTAPVCDKARIDVFQEGNVFKILEINAGGPIGGKDLVHALNGAMESIGAFREWMSAHGLESTDPLVVLSDYFRRIALERFSGPQATRIAFVWDESEEPHYERLLYTRDYLRRSGFLVEMVHAADLQYRDGALTHRDGTIDIVQLCIELDAITARPEINELLLRAYRDGAALFTYCPRSRLAGAKEFLAVCSDPQFHRHFTEQEIAALQESLPWTRIVTPALQPEIQGNKDGLVIKPCDGYSGKDVYLGKNVSQAEWEQVIGTCLADAKRNWIAQELVAVPRIEVPALSDGRIQRTSVYV